jgi:hypothetical protein
LKTKNCCPTKIAVENGGAKGRDFVPLHSFCPQHILCVVGRGASKSRILRKNYDMAAYPNVFIKKNRNTAFFSRICFVNTDETEKLILVYCNLMSF